MQRPSWPSSAAVCRAPCRRRHKSFKQVGGTRVGGPVQESVVQREGQHRSLGMIAVHTIVTSRDRLRKAQQQPSTLSPGAHRRFLEASLLRPAREAPPGGNASLCCSVCLFLSPSVSVCLRLSRSTSVCFCLSLPASLCVCVCMRVHASVCLSVCLSVCR